MKRKELERMLKDAGWWVLRQTKHVAWTNGIKTVFVPSHKEIKSWTVNEIFKHAGLRK